MAVTAGRPLNIDGHVHGHLLDVVLVLHHRHVLHHGNLLHYGHVLHHRHVLDDRHVFVDRVRVGHVLDHRLVDLLVDGHFLVDGVRLVLHHRVVTVLDDGFHRVVPAAG